MKIKKILAVMASAFMISAAFSGCSGKEDGKSAASVDYKWSNVAIGGGGYVTGMEYSKAEEGLAYARTDIGGAYRWVDSESKWVAITDFLGSEEWNLIGIEVSAPDPVDPKRFILRAVPIWIRQTAQYSVLTITVKHGQDSIWSSAAEETSPDAASANVLRLIPRTIKTFISEAGATACGNRLITAKHGLRLLPSLQRYL